MFPPSFIETIITYAEVKVCGRFYIDADATFLLNYFRIKYEPKIAIEHSVVYPSQTAPIIIGTSEERRIGPMDWGFRYPNQNKPIINARSETIEIKALFKQAFENRRCLVPATGFYEWSQYDLVKPKPQFAITLTDEPMMGMAGVYQKHVDDSGKTSWLFTVITQEAKDEMRNIHPRMPLLIHPDDFDLWLRPDSEIEKVSQLLHGRSMNLKIEPIEREPKLQLNLFD